LPVARLEVQHAKIAAMTGVKPHFSDDAGRDIDWGRTAEDYAAWRPGYPASFFERLRELEVGLPGQRVLDLATGTGALALPLAAAGCAVTGVDLASEQVDAARALAANQGLDLELFASRAEETGLPGAAFDIVTASQCFGYFDPAIIWSELRRLLAPGGGLVTSDLCWLAGRSEIARRSEELVLEFVPDWTGAGYAGRVPERPSWLPEDWRVDGRIAYVEELPFTRESWRGRFRACRPTGASMSDEELERFDAAHARLLEDVAPESFTIPHCIDAHLQRPS
jgi:SAM-dependent methyltransferase